MQSLKIALITTLIILSFAAGLGEDGTRINMTKNTILIPNEPVSVFVKCDQLNMIMLHKEFISDQASQMRDSLIWKASPEDKPIRRRASRKKTATKIT